MRASLNQLMADVCEKLAEVEMIVDAEATGNRQTMEELKQTVANLHAEACYRTVQLQSFIGMAQQRIWPSLETINNARLMLGMEPINDTEPT